MPTGIDRRRICLVEDATAIATTPGTRVYPTAQGRSAGQQVVEIRNGFDVDTIIATVEIEGTGEQARFPLGTISDRAMVARN